MTADEDHPCNRAHGTGRVDGKDQKSLRAKADSVSEFALAAGDEKSRKKSELFFENPLTNRKQCAIIVPVVERVACPKPSGEVKKVFENFFQKPIDKIKTMWYNNKVVETTQTGA